MVPGVHTLKFVIRKMIILGPILLILSIQFPTTNYIGIILREEHSCFLQVRDLYSIFIQSVRFKFLCRSRMHVCMQVMYLMSQLFIILKVDLAMGTGCVSKNTRVVWLTFFFPMYNISQYSP